MVLHLSRRIKNCSEKQIRRRISAAQWIVRLVSIRWIVPRAHHLRRRWLRRREAVCWKSRRTGSEGVGWIWGDWVLLDLFVSGYVFLFILLPIEILYPFLFGYLSLQHCRSRRPVYDDWCRPSSLVTFDVLRVYDLSFLAFPRLCYPAGPFIRFAYWCMVFTRFPPGSWIMFIWVLWWVHAYIYIRMEFWSFMIHEDIEMRSAVLIGVVVCDWLDSW